MMKLTNNLTGSVVLMSLLRTLSILLYVTLLLTGCREPLFSGDDQRFSPQPYLQTEPLLLHDAYAVQRVPPGYDANKVLAPMIETAAAVSAWLGRGEDRSLVRILLFSPREPEGERILAMSGTRHRATGYYLPRERVLIAAGEEKDPRLRIILRHETAHAELYRHLGTGVSIPFWLNEGVAALFEPGVDDGNRPKPAQDRERLLRHLYANEGSLYFGDLVDKPFWERTDGGSYARAWSLLSCLHRMDRKLGRYVSDIAGYASANRRLFRMHLLVSGETVESFEQGCVQRLGLLKTMDSRAPSPL